MLKRDKQRRGRVWHGGRRFSGVCEGRTVVTGARMTRGMNKTKPPEAAFLFGCWLGSSTANNSFFAFDRYLPVTREDDVPSIRGWHPSLWLGELSYIVCTLYVYFPNEHTCHTRMLCFMQGPP